jgi:hypothetical protein
MLTSLSLDSPLIVASFTDGGRNFMQIKFSLSATLQCSKRDEIPPLLHGRDAGLPVLACAAGEHVE